MIRQVEVEVERLVVDRLPGIVIHPLARRWQVRCKSLLVLRVAHARSVALPGTSDQTHAKDRYNRDPEQHDQAPMWRISVRCRLSAPRQGLESFMQGLKLHHE